MITNYYFLIFEIYLYVLELVESEYIYIYIVISLINITYF